MNIENIDLQKSLAYLNNTKQADLKHGFDKLKGLINTGCILKYNSVEYTQRLILPARKV